MRRGWGAVRIWEKPLAHEAEGLEGGTEGASIGIFHERRNTGRCSDGECAKLEETVQELMTSFH